MMGLQWTPVAVVRPGYLMVGAERFVPAGPPGRFEDVDDPPTQMQVELDHGRATKLITPHGEFWRIDPIHQTGTLILLAVLSALTCIGVLFGLSSVARWRLPQTTAQRLACGMRDSAAVLWSCALAAFAVEAIRALSDRNSLVFGWPGPLMLASSSAALGAALLSWAAAASTPFAWNGRDGWSLQRKLRFTATVVIFSVFGVLLTALGALQPWNP